MRGHSTSPTTTEEKAEDDGPVSLNVDDWVAAGNDATSPRRPLKLPTDWQPLDVSSLRSMLPPTHKQSKVRARLMRPKGLKGGSAMSMSSASMGPSTASMSPKLGATSPTQQERNRKAWERLQAHRAAELEALATEGNGGAKVTSKKKKKKKGKTAAQIESDASMAKALGLTAEQMEEIESASEIDEDRRQKYLDAFHKLDTDGGGTLSGEELIGVMAHLGEHMEPDEAQKLIDECDTDGDGDISFEEFIALMTAKQRVAAIAELMRDSNRRRRSPSPPPGDRRRGSNGATKTVGPSLPPLALQSRSVGRRNRASNPRRKRAHPQKLLGPEASASALRKELERANAQLGAITTDIKTEVQWIQENCDVTSIRAQMFAQRWGAEKLERVLTKVAMHKAQSVISRWREVVEWDQCQEEAQKYLQYRGGNVIVKLLEDWRKRKLIISLTTWTSEVKAQRMNERLSAALKIQPFVRGWLSRLRVTGYVRRNAATTVQRRWRGVVGRRRAVATRVLRDENTAASKIQRCFRGYKGRALFATIREARRQLNAVRFLQRRVRGWIGKRLANSLFLAAKRNSAATAMQCGFRCRAARRERGKREFQRLRVESAKLLQRSFRGRQGRLAFGEAKAQRNGAMLLQRQWRGLQGRKSMQQKQDAIRDRMARRIQSCWRGHLSRQEYGQRLADVATAERKLRESAKSIQKLGRGHLVRKGNQVRKRSVVKMQASMRGRAGRRAAIQARALKEEANRSASDQRERYEACCTMQTCWRRFWARHTFEIQLASKRAMHLEAGLAATTLQTAFRGRVGRKKMQRKKTESRAASMLQARARGKKDRERVMEMRARKALHMRRHRAALRMQCSWRGHKGRLGSHMVRQAHQQRALEMLKRSKADTADDAARRVQGCYRRKIARRKARVARGELKTRRQEEKEREMERKLKQHARRREEAAISVQCCYRTRQAKRKIAAAKLAYAERLANADGAEKEAMQQEQDEAMAAMALQAQFRKHNAETARIHRAAMKAADEIADIDASERLRLLDADEASLSAEEKRIRNLVMAANMQDLSKLNAKERKKVLRQRELLKAEAEKRDAKAKKSQDRIAAKELAIRKGLAARQIQSCWRENLPRLKFFFAKRATMRQMEQEAAALKLQGILRQSGAKRKVEEKKKEQKKKLEQMKAKGMRAEELALVRERQAQEVAALRLQSVMRGKKARKKADRVRKRKLKALEKKEEIKAASKLQAMARGRKERKAIAETRRELEQMRERADNAEREAQEAKAMLAQVSDAAGADAYAATHEGAVTEECVATSSSSSFPPFILSFSLRYSAYTSALGLSFPFFFSLSSSPSLRWVQYWDDAAQANYWFNPVTQEASWTDPNVAVAHDQSGYMTAGSATDYATDNGWETGGDGYATGGSAYDYSGYQSTGYDQSAGYDQYGQAAAGGYDQYGQAAAGGYDQYGQAAAGGYDQSGYGAQAGYDAQAAGGAAAGDGWSTHVDESGAQYYYNEFTGETQWA